MEDVFGDTGFECGGIRNLTPRQALEQCLKGAVLVDVRDPELNRFKMMDVPEVIYCPLSMLEERYRDLPWERPMIFADSAGLHSREAVEMLMKKEAGKGIANLAGGLIEWERDGLPLIIDKSERLSGSCMCQLRPREKKSG
jgi:rhodanese-related sulfurtransferase